MKPFHINSCIGLFYCLLCTSIVVDGQEASLARQLAGEALISVVRAPDLTITTSPTWNFVTPHPQHVLIKKASWSQPLDSEAESEWRPQQPAPALIDNRDNIAAAISSHDDGNYSEQRVEHDISDNNNKGRDNVHHYSHVKDISQLNDTSFSLDDPVLHTGAQQESNEGSHEDSTESDSHVAESKMSLVAVMPPENFLAEMYSEERNNNDKKLLRKVAQLLDTKSYGEEEDQREENQYPQRMSQDQLVSLIRADRKSDSGGPSFSSLLDGTLGHQRRQFRKRKSSTFRGGLNTIPGSPGTDFPVYNSIPNTRFNCLNGNVGTLTRPAGFYADVETQCQVYHYCHFDGRQDSFLCPRGTMFNQEVFVCDWWYNVNCEASESLYRLNDNLYQQDNRGFGGVLPRGHGNDGLLHDLKRLLDEARNFDLESDFNDEIKPSTSPNFFKATSPPSSIIAKRKSLPRQNLQQKPQRLGKRPPRVLQATTISTPTPTPTPARPRRKPRPLRQTAPGLAITTSSPFRSNTLQAAPTMKGSFYDPKNDLIVSYKSKPNGGVSVFYTAPKSNNRDFINRIKDLIQREQAKLAQNIQLREEEVATTTPTPSAHSIDYDYKDDYYYYDDDDDEKRGPVHKIMRGEAVSDLNVNTVDEDYDQQFNYYSDDGEDPEHMKFLEEQPPSFQTFASAPIVDKPVKHVFSEDYYYYDGEEPKVTTAAPAQQSPFRDYDYEYYSDDGGKPNNQLSRRALNKALKSLLTPAEEGKPARSRTNILAVDTDTTTPPQFKSSTFSKSFLPLSPSTLLYSLLPPPRKFVASHRFLEEEEEGRQKGEHKALRMGRMPQEEAERVRPWWSNPAILGGKARMKQQLLPFSPEENIEKRNDYEDSEGDVHPLEIPVTVAPWEFLLQASQGPSSSTADKNRRLLQQRASFGINGPEVMIGAGPNSSGQVDDLVIRSTLSSLLLQNENYELREAFAPKRPKKRRKRPWLNDPSGVLSEHFAKPPHLLESQVSKRLGKASEPAVKKASLLLPRSQKRRRRRKNRRNSVQGDGPPQKQRLRFGMKEATTTTTDKIKSLIRNVFEDLDEMDTLAEPKETSTAGNFAEEMVERPERITIGFNLTPDAADVATTIQPPLHKLENTGATWAHQQLSNTEAARVRQQHSTVRSWHQKLHLAKLAAWMNAKAKMEAAHLAKSIVALERRNADDYDTLPQGEEAKPDHDRAATQEPPTTTTTATPTTPEEDSIMPLDDILLDLGTIAMKKGNEEGMPIHSFEFFPNSNKTMMSANESLPSIDDIDVLPDGDGFINGDFYDDDFPLVDDAVITYQENENEWFYEEEEDDDDNHASKGGPPGIIIHDGSNRHAADHVNFHQDDYYFGDTHRPPPLPLLKHPGEHKFLLHDNFKQEEAECFVPSCSHKVRPQDDYYNNNIEEHRHYAPPAEAWKPRPTPRIKTVYPNLIPRPKPPHLLPRPTAYIASSTTPVPHAVDGGYYPEKHFYPPPRLESVDLDLLIEKQRHEESPHLTGSHPLDVAHHGSIGIIVDKSVVVSTPPPTPITLTTLIARESPITYSNSQQAITSTLPSEFATTTPRSTKSPIVVHSSTTTTTAPLVVLLHKKNQISDAIKPNEDEGYKTTAATPMHIATTYVPPSVSPDVIIHPASNSAAAEEEALGGSFSSSFLSRFPRISSSEGIAVNQSPSASQFNVVTALPGKSVSAKAASNNYASSTNYEPGSKVVSENAPDSRDGFQLSLLVPCLDPASGQKKNCLLVRKGNGSSQK